MNNQSIAQLPDLLAALSQELALIQERLLFVQRITGYVAAPPAFHHSVIKQFGALEVVTEQTVIRVTNRLTLETALFNPLRA